MAGGLRPLQTTPVPVDSGGCTQVAAPIRARGYCAQLFAPAHEAPSFLKTQKQHPSGRLSDYGNIPTYLIWRMMQHDHAKQSPAGRQSVQGF